MKPSAQIKQVRDWLIEQEQHLTYDWNPQGREHFKAQLVDLTKAIEDAELHEAVVHSSWEFFTGQWEPDDDDRAQFTTDLSDLVGPELVDPNA